MMRTATIGVLLAVALLTAGCTKEVVIHPDADAPGHQVDPGFAPPKWDRAVFIDKELQPVNRDGSYGGSAVAVQVNAADRTATDTLQVSAVLRNRTNTPIAVEASTRFMDARGVDVEQASAWQRVFLPANGTAVYQECSTRKGEVVHFVIQIRRAR
jgi:ABC-type proline/glycine betaine transport system substrate-binding protein